VVPSQQKTSLDDLSENDPSYQQQTSPEGSYSPISFSSAIKLLVSNNVAGSIIGRSGQTISDLQTQSSTRIKLSQAGDYYPGTQDRVCLVQGPAENVKKAVNLLLTRLYALQQQQHYHHVAWQRQQQEHGPLLDPMFGGVLADTPPLIPGFAFVVRILLPVPCCGMIIGKGGANVKQMVESSGVTSVRLYPKDGGTSESPFAPGQASLATAALVSATAERLVTITGPELTSCLSCLHIILDGMNSNPEISRYTNMTTSYTRVISAAQGAVAGAQGTPGRRESDQVSDSFLQGPEGNSAAVHRSSSHGFLEGQISASPIPFGAVTQASPSPSPFVAFGGHAGPFLPQESPVRPTLPSMQNSLYLMPSSAASFHSAQALEESISINPSHSAPDLLALQMQNSLRMSDPLERAGPQYAGPSSFVQQVPQPTHSPPGFIAQVAIAENLVGSILGRGGRTLNELQVLSNTRIRLSQRGEYVPGTRDRIVTIRGPTSQSVTTAQYLMSQRMVLPPTASTYMDRPDYGMTAYPQAGDYPLSDAGQPPL
jgi:RNA-binding protein Nova